MESSMDNTLETRNKAIIWPSNPITGYIPWENYNWKRHMHPNVHWSTITIVRPWNQPRCPLTDERIKKLWYIYTMEYYSVTKRETFESVLMRWIKRRLLLGRKVMTNLDSIFKSRDITLPTKVCLVKAMVFQSSCMDVRVALWRKLSAEEFMLLNCGVG